MASYVYFVKAGKEVVETPDKDLFLMSDQRRSHSAMICHYNSYTTFIRLPYKFYKKHFTFDKINGVYRTKLKHKEISQFSTIYDHLLNKQYAPEDFNKRHLKETLEHERIDNPRKNTDCRAPYYV